MPVMPAEAFLTIPFSLFTARQALPWLILTVALGLSALIGRHSLPRSWRRVRKISPEQVLDHKSSEEPVGPRMLCRRIVERAEQIRRAMLEGPSEIEIDMCAMGYGACLEDMGLLINFVKAELPGCTPIQRLRLRALRRKSTRAIFLMHEVFQKHGRCAGPPPGNRDKEYAPRSNG
jgi:hypothetical protein